MDGDSSGSDSLSKVEPSRGKGVFPVSYPVSSAPGPKKARASVPEVICLSDSDASSNAFSALSAATTRSALSGRGTGPAASAEDHRLLLDARRSSPDSFVPFVHRAVAAAGPVERPRQMRLTVHPPHPFVAKRQVRRSECSI